MHRALVALMLLVAVVSGQAAALAAKQAPPPTSAAKQKYPKVVLYSVSWCPHCNEAKEYFKSRNISYINKDVEADEANMKELTTKYKKQSVPVIVLDDKVVIPGFNKERFEKAVADLNKGK